MRCSVGEKVREKGEERRCKKGTSETVDRETGSK